MTIYKTYPTLDVVPPDKVEYSLEMPPPKDGYTTEPLGEAAAQTHLTHYRDSVAQLEWESKTWGAKLERQTSLLRAEQATINAFTELIKDAITDQMNVDYHELFEFARQRGLEVEDETEVKFQVTLDVAVNVTHVGELHLGDLKLEVSSYDGKMSVDHPDFESEITDVTVYSMVVL